MNFSQIETPLGPMLAIANTSALYSLEFIDDNGVEAKIDEWRKKVKLDIIEGRTDPINSIENELKLYFNHKLKEFKTPLYCVGSPFQKSVWKELTKIPFGKTISYADLATKIQKPSAFRAVGNANGSNNIWIVIPCHRVINSNGNLGGYAGGLERKKWLLQHEAGNA
ncbi:MAG: methylated-DNA--[protein]-cysteine S-methyltransferase [Bdellovibrionota bacterium]